MTPMAPQGLDDDPGVILHMAWSLTLVTLQSLDSESGDSAGLEW